MGYEYNLTAFLGVVSRENAIALSTLKFNAHVLKSLGLIEHFDSIRVTEFGRLVLNLIKDDTNAGE